MARTLVKVRVPVPSDADAGDAVQVYTDNGSGVVGLNTPLLARPRAMHATGRRSRGFGTMPFGVGEFGRDTVAPENTGVFGETDWTTPFGTTPKYVEAIAAVRPTYGVVKFAARVIDREGNVQGSPVEVAVMVSSSTPPGIRSIGFGGMQSDKPVIAFEKNLE